MAYRRIQPKKRTFNLDGKKPKVEKNVHLIDGWVEETLENFLSKILRKLHLFTLIWTHINQHLIFLKIKKKLQHGFDNFI